MKNLILLLIIIAVNLNAQSSVAYLNAPNFEKTTATLTKKVETSKSFELIGGMIFIEANVNGKMGTFILDTGAPGVILNEKPMKKSEDLVAGGLNGTVEIGEVDIENFAWGIINLSNIKGYSLDISHLEESFEKEIAGLIGFNVLSDFELLFDYENKQVQILSAHKNELHKNNKPLQKVAFQKQGHLPVIQAKIGNKKYYFGIDTGAEVNLLDAAILSTLEDGILQINESTTIQGLDNSSQLVQTGTIKNTKIQAANFPEMDYLFVDFSEVNKNREIKIDGLLGFTFLTESKVSINYKKQKIYFWD